MTSPYDNLPIDVRRRNWGWFGDPWPSGICYDEDGRLIEEMRKPFPEGESCLYCRVPFEPGDNGQAMPHLSRLSEVWIRHVHKECMLRSALGSYSCYVGEHNHHDGRTYREQALELWACLASTEAMGGNRERSRQLEAGPGS